MDQELFITESPGPEGTARLVLNSGLGPKAFAQAKNFSLAAEKGFLVSATGTVSPWTFDTVLEREGKICFVAGAFDGVPLSGLETEHLEVRWRRAKAYLRALAALEKSQGPELTAQCVEAAPAAILVDQNGAVLFAPPKLVLRALNARSGDRRLRDAGLWNSPDLPLAHRGTFNAAAILRAALAGEAPFSGTDESEVNADMRDGRFVPTRLAIPGCAPRLCALMDGALAPQGERGKRSDGIRHDSRAPLARPTLADITDFVASQESAPITPLSDTELAGLQEEKERQIRSRDASTGAKRFWRRNATVIAVVATVLVILGFSVRSIIDGNKDRFTTEGLGPLAVVETYYGAMDELDHEKMDACVMEKVSGVAKGDINATMNLFVITRVRMAYEQKKAFISAKDWLSSGALPTEAMVFGTTGLSIQAVDQDLSDGQVSFTATYTFWKPQSDSPESMPSETADGVEGPKGEAQEAAARSPEGIKTTDLLTLTDDEGLWRISDIQREEQP